MGTDHEHHLQHNSPFKLGHHHHQSRRRHAELPGQFSVCRRQKRCSCGFFGNPVTATAVLRKECTCAPAMVTRYQKRISGPLLDRISTAIPTESLGRTLRVLLRESLCDSPTSEVPRVEYDKLADERAGEPSAAIRARVQAARDRQTQRFKGDPRLVTNADGNSRRELLKLFLRKSHRLDVREYCKLDATGQNLIKTAMAQLQLSARAFHRILKLARTIADLAGADAISPPHLAEAIQYRPRRQEL
ncbi:MAG: ATP-binding protein [Thermoflexales bacterium]|nr:ATP-binding protein [Thermoflexales bacterium]